MDLKFAIKSIAGPSAKEGAEYVRFTGNDEIFIKSCERKCSRIGWNGFGPEKEPIVKFITGLNEKDVDTLSWFTDAEKEEVKKFILEKKNDIYNYFGGADIMEDRNKDFWTSSRAWGRLKIDNYKLDQIQSTKDPRTCLLYLGIISGAWLDLVAPNREFAERDTSIPFYLALESEAEITDAEIYVTKLDAQGALAELAKESGDGMFILAWCLQYDSASYGAYSRTSTSKSDLIKYHSQFIDGLITTKKGGKRNAPKLFTDYAELWKNSQTRAKVMVEAYVKAGEYYSLINKGKKQYQTKEGTVLGNTIAEAVDTLMKKQHAEELDRLRDAVEKKWSE